MFFLLLFDISIPTFVNKTSTHKKFAQLEWKMRYEEEGGVPMLKKTLDVFFLVSNHGVICILIKQFCNIFHTNTSHFVEMGIWEWRN